MDRLCSVDNERVSKVLSIIDQGHDCTEGEPEVDYIKACAKTFGSGDWFRHTMNDGGWSTTDGLVV